MKTDSRKISCDILTNVFLRGRNLKTEFSLKTKNIPLKKDISFIKALVYGVVRLKKSIDDEIAFYYKGNYKKLKESFKNCLRIGVYQISMMDKVPNYASVNSTVEASKSVNFKFSKTVNAILIKYIKDKKTIDLKSPSYNYNQSIINQWKKFYSKKQIEDLCKWNDTLPNVWFYVGKKNIKEVEETQLEFFYHDKFKNYISFLNTGEAIDELVKKELVYAQSPSSGLVVDLLDVNSKDCVLDACAAPGSKSKGIYQLLGDKGRLDINDFNQKRYQKLKSDFKNYDTEITMKDASIDKFKFYDKILLDVPCSSIGTIQKNPDIKWKNINFEKLEQIQIEILKNMSKYVKKEGVVVYSTCSLNENENWKIIDRFLTLNQDFCLDSASNYIDPTYVDKNGCMSIFPPTHHAEGIFAARLVKK